MTSLLNESLEKIIALMPGIVFWKDIDGKYQGCNNNAANLAHLSSRDEIVGKTIYDLFERPLADIVTRIDTHVMSSQLEQVQEEQGVDLQGNPAIYLTHKIPIFDDVGNVLGLVGMSIDITSQKQLEHELRQAQEKTAQINENLQRAVAAANAADAADAASHAKTMFLANMSHDLKTPLAGIISTAEYLSQSIVPIEAKRRANDIVNSGLRLLELLIEIIEVSRLDSKAAPKMAAFKLQDLIDDLIQLIKPVIIDKGLLFKIYYQDNMPISLIGDRWQLYRIMLNLLSNAIKFTHEGSIHLTLLAEAQDAEHLRLKILVKDTGIGISSDKQGIIFEEFTRLTHAHNEVYKGTGLGLFIVKKFIESMQGQVSVQSTEGQGSTFTCLIPFKTLAPLPKTRGHGTFTETLISIHHDQPLTLPADHTVQPFKDLAILLVEDNAIAARATKAILQSLGCRVDIASSGTEALALFSTNPYHLVYLDLGLPDLDGFEVSQKMRQWEATQASAITPIIALSAHIDATIKAHCLTVGMTEALTKPLLRIQAKKNIQQYSRASAITPDDKLEPPLEIIDLALAAAILGTDLDNAKATLTLIMQDLPSSHQAITRAYQQKDTRQLCLDAHKLRGGLLYAGAARLEKAVLQLEQAANSGSELTLAQSYQHYCVEMQLLTETYRQLMQ